MALRRPRIKAAALLVTKRKPRDIKIENSLTAIKTDPESSEQSNPNRKNGNEKDFDVSVSTTSTRDNETKAKTGSDEHVDTNVPFKHSQETIEKVCTGIEKHNDTLSVTDDERKPSDQANGQSNNHVLTSKECVEAPNINETSVDTGDVKLTETEDSFKCPASIEYTRNNNNPNNCNVGVDDVFYTDMEEITLKTGMQKNVVDNNTTASKQQGRQRIRPVPSLQRRNSLIGISAQAEDNTAQINTISQQQTTISESETPEPTIPVQKLQPIAQRRERHYSASMVQSPLTSNSGTGQHHYTPHKFTPTMGLGRIRTESNCSAFSDTFVTASKIRKIDEHNSRSNHRKDFACRFVNGNLDKSSLKMFDLIYYNPTTNPMEKRTTLSTIKKESVLDENDTKITPNDNKEEVIDQKNSIAMPVPQLKLNANGDLILDEKTLEIETTAEQEARKVLAKSSLIFLDENTGMNGFYRRQKRTKDWLPEETIKFYRCLQTVGTDFSLMCQLFPKRTRRDLKLKFKKEERSNLSLINKALLYPKLFNIDDLKTQLETEEREKEEALLRWKEIQKQDAKTIKKVKINGSIAARALKHGEDVYENENVVKRKLGRRSKTTEKKKPNVTKKAQGTQQTLYLGSTNDDNEATGLPTKLPLKPKNNDIPVVAKQTSVIKSNTITNGPVKIELMQVFEMAVKDEHSNYDNVLTNSPKFSDENVPEELEQEQQAEEDGYANNYIENASNSNSVELDEINDYGTINQDLFIHDDKSEAELKTFVNLDNGAVNTFEYEDDNDEDYITMDTMPATPASVSQREVDECDMQQILMDLAAGSLVLVSTLDPDNADQVVNEIYMMDKTTGELCDKPLDIPESIVQSVLSVMT